ncbi:MAG: hypothetical protein J7539_17625 [Niabella sp.]|nr:hypothetical protein [Niabella sp.]
MSLLLGSWHYSDGAGVSYALQKMYEAVRVPHEKYEFAAEQQVGFGCIYTYNTPESVFENTPVFLKNKQLLFTGQGRIDNRDRLAARLGIKINDQYADGALILEAYIKWGKDCVRQLRGDWSFAVFDYSTQELFIARDPMSYTAIYYYQCDSGFYFSSSIKSLLKLPVYNKQLNEIHFVRYLTVSDIDQIKHDTYFKGIFSIPNAHTLTVKNKKINLHKYWRPEDTQLRIYKNKQDYAEELLELFTGAVQARLRSYQSVAATLSGGLDSSTVSYVAAELLKSGNKRLTTLSHVPLFTTELLNDREKQNRVLDETFFIRETAKASGNIHPVLLNSSGYSIINGMRDAIEIFDSPAHAAANAFWFLNICKTARQEGFSTLLSGEGGNGNISFAAIDYLLPLKWKRFVRHPYRFLKTQIAKPLALKYLNSLYDKKTNTTASFEKYAFEIFAQPHLLEKYKIVDNIQNNSKKRFHYIPDVKERKEQFIDIYQTRSIVGTAAGQYFGFEMRDPTTDVDVTEYFFSIPNEVFFDEHYNNRMLVKRMMKGKLPDTVLFEKRRGLQTADIVYRAKSQADEITDTLNSIKQSAAADHYINVSSLITAWQQYLQMPHVEPFGMECLLKALHFALFIQQNFD